MSRLFGYLCGLLLLVGCASLSAPVQPPNISLVDFQLAEAGLFEQRYVLLLRVQNPNPLDLGIRGMDYRLAFNGAEFARGVSDRQVVLPAYGEAMVSVDLISSLASALRTLNELSGESISYELSGGISLGDSRVRLPFDYRGDLVLEPAEQGPAL